MSIEYYSRRLKASLAAADAAPESSSRVAHEGLAKAYRRLLDGLFGQLAEAKRKVSPRSRERQLGDALAAWENEGGGRSEQSDARVP